MTRPPRPCSLLVAAATLVLLLGCASTGPPPPWRSGHPDPSSLSLLGSAQAGSCAASAPDPSQAPAAISFQGHEYVQKTEQPALAEPSGGVEIDHTGDWTFFEDADGDLTMATPTADYLYVAQSC